MSWMLLRQAVSASGRLAVLGCGFTLSHCVLSLLPLLLLLLSGVPRAPVRRTQSVQVTAPTALVLSP
jgi:hypothetical protein